MSLTVMKLMLVLGIIGHALNMYCDRILSVFPNGTLKLEDIKTFGKDDKAKELYLHPLFFLTCFHLYYHKTTSNFTLFKGGNAAFHPVL